MVCCEYISTDSNAAAPLLSLLWGFAAGDCCSTSSPLRAPEAAVSSSADPLFDGGDEGGRASTRLKYILRSSTQTLEASK